MNWPLVVLVGGVGWLGASIAAAWALARWFRWLREDSR